MIPPSIQMMVIIGAASWLLGAGSASYLMAKYKDATWSAQVEATRAEAAELAQAETDKVLRAERAARTQLAKMEVDYAEIQRALDAAHRDNRRLVRERGLFDPGARARCPGDVPGAATISGDPAVAAGPGAELSGEAVAFLLTLTEDADRAAAYAATCAAWGGLVTGESITGEGQP